ncbi:alpha/beta hydrolase [Terriglobus sp. 2YAB30_2]|uniref:alpha/beta hydrolase n=1 Tax=unclassified Terriglobus TaxID=2628988 RepID=UPI003F9948A4
MWPPFLCMRKNLFRWCAVLIAALTISAAAQTWDPPVGRRVIYKKVDGRELGLWILEPKDVGARDYAAERPAVLLIHGGGWVNGAPGVHNDQAKAVAAHGAVAILLQYRLLAPTSHEEPRICVEDTKSAMRWIRAHAAELHLDPKKIAAGGSSAGGYNAAYAAVGAGWDDSQDDLRVSARPDALVLLNPALDVHYASNLFHHDEKLSPMSYVNKDAPPMLIMSGSDDPVIHADVLRKYASQLKAAGARCELHIYPGQVHSFYKKEPYLSETNALMVEFLYSLGFVYR